MVILAVGIGVGVYVATQDQAVHVRSAAATAYGATSSPPAPTPGRKSRPLPRVIVLVEENHENNRILGSSSAPFLNSLAASGTLLTNYYGVRHPSLPNYLAMIGGDTFGISSDCTGCRVDASNLVDQLEAAHISWKGYFQGLPAPCSNTGSAGSYAKKHDPFMYFNDIRENPSRCRNVVPIDQFLADVAAGRLPQFVFVVPDEEHDMHSGSVRAGDSWVRTMYARLAASPAWREDTRLVVTFDEGESDASCCGGLAAGGHIATIVVGPRVRAGVQDGTAYSHYSLLASVETLFGLSRLGYAAAPSTALIPALQ